MNDHLASILRGGRRFALILALAASGWATTARAQQAQAKTADISFAVAADGSMNMSFQMTFDAANWRAWKAMIGDEPARMRAQMRHQFAAMTLEDFKLERDDLNRVAKMSMRSPSGPDLREDGSLQIPVDGYFRLVNHAGREWFFSGNNPHAGGSLNNVKVTLPASVMEAHVANADSQDQALVFALAAPPSASRWFYVAGGLVSLLGATLIVVGLLVRRQQVVRVPAPSLLSRLPDSSSPIPPVFVPPAPPPPFSPRPAAQVSPPRFVRQVEAEELPPDLPTEESTPEAEEAPHSEEPSPPAFTPRPARPATPPPFQPRGGYTEPD